MSMWANDTQAVFDDLRTRLAAAERERDALQSELSDLRALVREIGEREWEDSEYGVCVFCDETLWRRGQSPDPHPENHKPDCLWLRAQRWRS
jgi:hypothetical protein